MDPTSRRFNTTKRELRDHGAALRPVGRQSANCCASCSCSLPAPAGPCPEGFCQRPLSRGPCSHTVWMLFPFAMCLQVDRPFMRSQRQLQQYQRLGVVVLPTMAWQRSCQPRPLGSGASQRHAGLRVP